MFHLLDVRLAQLILIQVGIVFQLAAVWALYCSSSSQQQHSANDDQAADSEVPHEEHQEKAEQQKPRWKPTVRQDPVRAEGLDKPAHVQRRVRQVPQTTQTTTMKFHQSFNYPRHGA